MKANDKDGVDETSTDAQIGSELGPNSGHLICKRHVREAWPAVAVLFHLLTVSLYIYIDLCVIVRFASVYLCACLLLRCLLLVVVCLLLFACCCLLFTVFVVFDSF